MTRFGTDVMALACIVGGAAVGGVGTMALAQDGGHASQEAECVVINELAEKVKASQVVVAMGGHERVVISTPQVSVHRHRPHCVSLDESIDWSEAELEMQEAMLRMEEARMQMEQMRHMEFDFRGLEDLDVRIEGVGFELDLGKEISEEIERDLAEEMARLEVELKRLEEIGR